MGKIKLFIILAFTLPVLIFIYYFANNDGPAYFTSKGAYKMQLTSSAFEHEGQIPKKYTCDGENINPPLTISEIPDGTKSLVIIVEDPDAPSGTWVHWTVWDIDPNNTEILENITPRNSTEGITDFGSTGYGGPCPPSGEHRYYFRAYALDDTLNLDSVTTRSLLDRFMKGHIIADAELMGKYSR